MKEGSIAVHVSRIRTATAALLALALTLAACGGDDKASTSSTSTTAGAKLAALSGDAPGQGKSGGKLTVVANSDVDFVDPGQTYFYFGYMVHYAVNRQLYAYAPGGGDLAEPDIADGQPEISADNKTITVRLKSGVRYSPPVDREVKAQDVKYAFERAFSANVPSPYAGGFFASIVGVPTEPGPVKPISGIETPDDRTIVFKLSKPDAALVSQALAMPISTPVPEEYAKPFDAKSPSTYDQHVAFTGPYMIKADAEGKLIGRKPGRSIELVRNPNWDAQTDHRPAYADEILIQEGNADTAAAARRILNGTGLLQGDGSTPAPVVKTALKSQRAQLAIVPVGGYQLVALNSTIEPLGNLDVRKAIVAVSDRNALRLASGGVTAGDLATHFLPPGFPGFDDAGGAKGSGVDFLAKPTGDLAVAKKYMLAAKAADASLPIDADGMWTGTDKLLMVATNSEPGKGIGQVAANQFEKLGFKVNLRLVAQDTLYTKYCNVPAAKVAVCPNVGFYRDFDDAQALLDPVFNGDNINPQNNANWAQLDDPAINKAMDDAAKLKPGAERNAAWGKIDSMIVGQAPGVPFLWSKTAIVKSKDVVGVVNPYTSTWDLTYSSLKQP